MRSPCSIALAFLGMLFVSTPHAALQEDRVFEFTYEVRAPELPSDRAVDVFIPMPLENADQIILDQSVASSLEGEPGVEDVHGNRYLKVHRAAGDNTPIEAAFTWQVQRRIDKGELAEPTEDELALYLAPNRLVPVKHEVLDPILAEVHAMRADDSPAATARAIYDWVVDNVEYKKVGTGWGNGDTFWACSERYGNCTDFHALFVALARTEGIPARFEIGFPVPMDRPDGNIGGYHCWVKFYLPGQRWVPIDASEAAKHPEQRELLYGTHPADRIHFTTGRDLTVSESSVKQPLNYFIYPYVEVDGKQWQQKLDTRFSFRELRQTQSAR